MRKIFDKAQGATEYMLILAGAIFVAAILLALLANMSGITKNEAQGGLADLFCVTSCDVINCPSHQCESNVDCPTKALPNCSGPPACVCVAGGGGPTHKECSGTSCVNIAGAGTDECTTNLDCGGIITHKECSGTSCVNIAGAGTDECTTNLDC
ncbi:MAG: hypothetical protein V1672_02205, partial [Candidatus Diapherotrites archaeon]